MTAQTLTLVQNDQTDTDGTPSGSVPAVSTALIYDSLLLRTGLQHILRNTPFTISEAVPVTGPKRLQYCSPGRALLIIEANQNTSRVLDVIRQVREQSPETRIVVLADQFDLGFVRSGHAAGVNGFCSSANRPDVLIRSLELVMLGESVLPSEVLHSIFGAASLQPEQTLNDNRATEVGLSDLKVCKLSARETEILSYLKEGAPNKIIARQCDVTEATVKVHVKAILRKIGATNRTQAAMWASQRLPRRGGASVDV